MIGGFTFHPGLPTTSLPKLVGFAMPGMEVDDSSAANPGTNGTTFQCPTHADVDYAATKGINFLTFTFSWQQMQPTLGGSLYANYLNILTDIVNYSLSKGMYVCIRIQSVWRAAPLSNGGGNYAGYGGKVIGASGGPTNAQFAQFWGLLANVFKGSPRVIFDLMNEPNTYVSPTQTAALWFSAAQAAITAIRATGASNVIFVEGMSFSAACAWNSTSDYGSTSNSAYFLGLVDPHNNLVACVHNYTDGSTGYAGANTDISNQNSSTTGDNTIFGENMDQVDNGGAGTTGVTKHARANKYKIFVGEMGIAANATVGNPSTAVANIAAYCKSNSDVVLGVCWWVMGSSFYQNASQPYELYPHTAYSPDTAQMPYIATLLSGIRNL